MASQSVFSSDLPFDVPCVRVACSPDVGTVFNLNVYVPNAKFLPIVQSSFRYFADHLFESTNQAHRLGVVTYVMDWRDSVNADVIIDTTNFSTSQKVIQSKATVNGYGKIGEHITLFIFTGDTVKGTPILDDSVSLGSALAHEWGHYAYGLGDEYWQSTGQETGKPVIFSMPPDTAGKYSSSPSLMRGTFYRFFETINYSTQWNLHKNWKGVAIPDSMYLRLPFSSAGVTVDSLVTFTRRYLESNVGLSAWGFLARDTSLVNIASNYFPDLQAHQPRLTDTGLVYTLVSSVTDQIYDTIPTAGVRVDLGTPPIGYIGSRHFLSHSRIDTLLPLMTGYVVDLRLFDPAQAPWQKAIAFYAAHKNLENHRTATSGIASPCMVAAFAVQGDYYHSFMKTAQSLSTCKDSAENMDIPARYFSGNDSTPVNDLVDAIDLVLEKLNHIQDSLAARIVQATGKTAKAPKKIVLFSDGGFFPGNIYSLKSILKARGAELEVVQIGYQPSKGLQKAAVKFWFFPGFDFLRNGWLMSLWNFPNLRLGVNPGIIEPNTNISVFPINRLKIYQDIRFEFSDTGNTSLVSLQAFKNGQAVSVLVDTLQNVGTAGKLFSVIARSNGMNRFDSLKIHNSGNSALRYSLLYTDTASASKSTRITAGYGTSMNPVVSASAPVAIRCNPAPGFYTPNLQVKAVVMDSSGTPLDTIPLQDSAKTGTYLGWYLGYPRAGIYWVNTILHGDSQQVLWSINEARPTIPVPEFQSLESLQEKSGVGQFFVEGVVEHVPATCGHGGPNLSLHNKKVQGLLEGPDDVDCYFLRDTSIAPLFLHLANVVGNNPTVLLKDSEGNTLGNESLHAVRSVVGYWSWEIPPALLQAGLQVVVRASVDQQGAASYSLVLDSGSPQDAPRLTALLESQIFSQANATYTGLGIRITNYSGSPLKSFKVRYYFSTEHFVEPAVSDWWSASCTAKRIQLGSELWAVELDYKGYQLAPGASFSIAQEDAIGIHYPDWSTWNTANDWSYLAGGNFQENSRLVLLDSNGAILQGNPPPAEQFLARTPLHQVRLRVKDDQFYSGNWTGPRIQLENLGDSLTDFQITTLRRTPPLLNPASGKVHIVEFVLILLGEGTTAWFWTTTDSLCSPIIAMPGRQRPMSGFVVWTGASGSDRMTARTLKSPNGWTAHASKFLTTTEPASGVTQE